MPEVTRREVTPPEATLREATLLEVAPADTLTGRPPLTAVPSHAVRARHLRRRRSTLNRHDRATGDLSLGRPFRGSARPHRRECHRSCIPPTVYGRTSVAHSGSGASGCTTIRSVLVMDTRARMGTACPGRLQGCRRTGTRRIRSTRKVPPADCG